MRRKAITAGLLATVLLQAGVLAGEYLGAMHPLWTGRAVYLETVPVDPRSLFRGNYARLRYPFSTIPRADLDADQPIRQGEVVYVRLQPGTDGLHAYAGASLSQPSAGTYLRGRVRHVLRRGSGTGHVRVRYGIEAWFAPKEQALALERELRDGGIARVMVATGGKSRLTGVSAAFPAR